MAVLVWVMMGLAIWHFTVYLPDRFWGGIVGAFVGALIGAVLFGLIVNGFSVPGATTPTSCRRSRRSRARCSAWASSTPRASGAASERLDF